MPTLYLVILIIALALVFDFLNGFHDSANSIATVVSTRVLTPLQAVAWAAFFNFVSAFTFGTSVASTVGKGFVDTHIVTPWVILAAVLGAIVWDLLTWWWGLPTSSSHAIIGGYAGAAVARAMFERGIGSGFSALILGKWPMTLAFIVIAPLLGLAAAFLMMIVVYWLFRKSTPLQMDSWFRKLQLISAAALSFSHGTNDAQKTMGLITEVLVSAKILKDFPRTNLGDPCRSRCHRPRHIFRRLAHCPYHGEAAHQTETAYRILRRNGVQRWRSCMRPTLGFLSLPRMQLRAHSPVSAPSSE